VRKIDWAAIRLGFLVTMANVSIAMLLYIAACLLVGYW